MNTDYTAQFLVGTSTAVATATFNFAVAGQINWIWVAVAFAVPFFILQVYQSTGFSPFRKWRVMQNNSELRAQLGQADGNGAWELDASQIKNWVIFGPYIPLSRGKYRATFRLKINNYSEDDNVADMDVCARHGGKLVALRRLTSKDFRKPDKYQEFAMDYYLLQDENEVEFRLSTDGAKSRLTLDCVTLARRVL